MNKLMVENVEDVSIGNSFFRAPERELLNSFSKPVREIDKYYQEAEEMGELNQDLEILEI